MEVGIIIAWLLGTAVLLPLLSFALILLFGPQMGKGGRQAGFCATGAILGACALSMISLGIWIANHGPSADAHASHHESGDHDSHEHDSNAEHSESQHDQEHSDDEDSNSNDHADASGLTAFVALADGHDLESHDSSHSEGHGHHDAAGPSYTYEVYTLGNFGSGKMSISVYVDSLTVCMFSMVTLIASCIHFYAMGYMHDELVDGNSYVDHEVTMSDGSHLHRPGRFHRFFQALSLFCFSMLGLVLSGNIAMTFVFWELVGICSYFLIGFYVERKSASTAANKAFIVNRVGDFGMIIGLMALWASLGTFSFGGEDGLFAKVRPAAHGHQLQTPDGMVKFAAKSEVEKVVGQLGPNATVAELDAAVDSHLDEWRDAEASNVPGGYGRWLLIVAGVGIFCGCVGKSAQFPLHVWLPDAMEGPTPVSALVHSATMVAAGVFLVARFYPVFCPEVLLVIAVCGAITLFMAATIAITATDIKRVLAYSTVSQLGYMMLSLGLGGWLAGVMHLFTHAFFKSLLFMCSGSVIHAVHTNEMTEMGGLRKKMPWTSATMLIGCMAIAGAGFPFAIFGHHLGLSGYYSKDAIVEQAWLFRLTNPSWGNLFFVAAAGGAAITAFYMFRLWFMTFAGQPRNQERYDHAHESPPIMYRPLIVLSVFAIAAAWGPIQAMMGSVLAAVILLAIKFWPKSESQHNQHGHVEHGHDHHSHGDDHGHGHEHHGLPPINVALGLAALVFIVALVWRPTLSGVTLSSLLEQSRPAGTLPDQKAALLDMTWPNEHDSHAPAIKMTAGWIAFGTAISGFTLAVLFYGLRKLDAGQAKAAFAPIHKFLINKWWFDELYQILFVQPAHWLAAIASWIDKNIFDRFLDGAASTVRRIAVVWENFADRQVVDGFVNGLASRMYATGANLRGLQTGSLRQYVLFIVVGTLTVFVLGSFVWNYAFAG